MTDNRTTELLPCPFCGGKAAIYEEIIGGYIVQCHDCCAQVGIMTREHAIAAWNQRHVETCRITASATDGLCTDRPRQYFELSCGHSFTLDGLDPPNYCEVCGAKVVDR